MTERDPTGAPADPAARLLHSVRAGEDIVLDEGGDAALLDRLASSLAEECRVVRVSAPAAGLSLSGFMAQVAGNTDLAGQDDSVLEAGYRRLATPDTPGQRIALVMEGAERVQRAALRFIQHLARGAPALVLVLVAGPEFERLLEDPDLAGLRARLAAARRPEPVANPVPVPTAAPALVAAEGRERVSTMSVRSRRVPVWALAGVGMAASAAVAVWMAPGARGPVPPATVLAGVAPSPVLPVAVPAPVKEPARAMAPVQQAEAPPAPAPVQRAEPIAPPAPVQQAEAPPPALPEPARQQAMLTPQPVLARPAEPDRAPARAAARPAEARQADARQAEARQSDARASEPAHATVRRTHAARPSGRAPDFDRGPAYWEDERPRPVYSGPMPPFWGRPRDMVPYDPAPPGGPYIGTYTADSYGVRTFRYAR